jgi:hypothetical protein
MQIPDSVAKSEESKSESTVEVILDEAPILANAPTVVAKARKTRSTNQPTSQPTSQPTNSSTPPSGRMKGPGGQDVESLGSDALNR